MYTSREQEKNEEKLKSDDTLPQFSAQIPQMSEGVGRGGERKRKDLNV